MVRILGSHPSDPGSNPGNGSSRVKTGLLKIGLVILLKFGEFPDSICSVAFFEQFL
jgi:hypothetical protein